MSQPPGPPEFPGYQQYFILTLTLDAGDSRARLTLTGPKAPGIGATQTIGVGRDAAGDYHFLVGSGEDHVYKPKDVPAEILKMLGGGGGPPTNEVMLPARDVLKRKSDGAFMTFEQYEANRRAFHSPGSPAVSGKVVLWPKLTPEMFSWLVDFYRGKGRRPLPPDAGDYPMPSGSTGVG